VFSRAGKRLSAAEPGPAVVVAEAAASPPQVPDAAAGEAAASPPQGPGAAAVVAASRRQAPHAAVAEGVA
jgi:hypothetical protein